jgi:hypothetical protein
MKSPLRNTEIQVNFRSSEGGGETERDRRQGTDALESQDRAGSC